MRFDMNDAFTAGAVPEIVPVPDTDRLNRQPPVELEAAVGEISFQRTEAELRVLCDGEVFTSLHFGDVQKPFLYPVISARGVSITRGYPMELRSGETAFERRQSAAK